MRRLKHVSSLASAAVLTFSAVLSMGIVPAANAAAATCTWTGGGSDSNFSTAANWSGCSGAPVAGDNDVLVFDESSLTQETTINNDIANLQVGGMTFSGANQNYASYKITGSTFTLNGDVTLTSVSAMITASVKLGTDVTITSSGSGSGGLAFGEFDGSSATTIDTQGHKLTYAATSSGAGCGYRVQAALAGSGELIVNSNVILSKASPSFTGVTTVNSGMFGLNDPGAINSGGVTVNDGGSLVLSGVSNPTYTFPISLSGSGADQSTGTLKVLSNGVRSYCSGGGNGSSTVTLSGPVTLGSDVVYSGDANTKITGTYTPNGHSFSVMAGQAGTITTPTGTTEAPARTVTVAADDKQPSQSVTIGNNETYVIDGQRGSVSVESGGVLKGTGAVGQLDVFSNGMLAPGHSPGCLSSGNFSLSGTYQVELGGTVPCTGYDQMKVTGTVALLNGTENGTLDVILYNGYVPKVGQSYTIIDNDGSDAVTYNFKGLVEGAEYTNQGVTYKVTYKGGDGNDVVLTVTKIDASKLPKTPNTGFAMVATHPVVALGMTFAAAFALLLAARRTKSVARR